MTEPDDGAELLNPIRPVETVLGELREGLQRPVGLPAPGVGAVLKALVLVSADDDLVGVDVVGFGGVAASTESRVHPRGEDERLLDVQVRALSIGRRSEDADDAPTVDGEGEAELCPSVTQVMELPFTQANAWCFPDAVVLPPTTFPALLMPEASEVFPPSVPMSFITPF
jgi:hypothetical protein